MARYTISGPSPSAVNFPYPFDTFQLTPSLGCRGLGTDIPLAFLQLQTHLRQGYQRSTVWREWWAQWQESKEHHALIFIIIGFVIMVDQETTDV